MAETIRWGILGAGSMAEAFARGLKFVPDASVSAIASRNPDRAREAAARLGIPGAVAGFDELVASSNVDIVYIATPSHLHREHMLLALGAGKPVLCEKPFALDADQAREVADRARARKVFCMEAMWTRFLPATRRLVDILDTGQIGEPRLLSAQIGYPYVFEEGSRLWDPQAGGGALLDLGVYLVSFALTLLGPVEEVAGLAIARGQGGVDENVAVSLLHARGRLSSLAVSLSGATANEAVIAGSLGRLRVHEPVFRPERLSIRPASPIRPGAGGGGGRLAGLKGIPMVRSLARRVEPIVGLVGRKTRSELLPIAGNGYQYQAIEAMRCLRSGEAESPLLPLDHSIAVLDILDRIRRSWRLRSSGA
ncbi:Gfo/Idh/MocA family protein [Tautonia sociabilis]|uniref:Gfo/Idh/MocA family oxidoreductase n=1 Tax=Tautonia sociabilis TaxID=2080755 RepID=A0A432MPC9_9BACT|nr:Gfo/Idh/MocA family oxidoreductase [Tautonia sociabilis]RUL88928.1 Gfo/Idh/MocA family oxidoreductase [Tautonia sociabilis]